MPPFIAGSTVGPRVRLHAADVLLSVEGFAVLEQRATGRSYVYEGPNGRWFMRDLTLESVDAIRRRLRAAGVADSAIVTQLNPSDGRWYVRVHTSDTRWNDAIAAAISGTAQVERDAVRTTTFGDACTNEQHALARAVADALERARRIAAGLRATIDLQPVAVLTGFGSGFASCAERGSDYSPPAPVPRHISGQLKRREPDDGGAFGVFATFRIEHPDISGAVRSHVASDDAMSFAVRFGYVPPPITYIDAVHDGHAQLETRVPTQRVRIDMLLSPDNRHAFRAIDPGLAAGLAAKLGVSAAQYAAAFEPNTERGNMPTPDQMLFEAEFPNRGPATERALSGALMSAQSAGYGGFKIVPESNGCAAVDDALALDAIRAAAGNTKPSERTGRVIAIDLRGPFTVDGVCSTKNSGVATWAVRNAKIQDVRLAAYARVSYGH